MTGRKDISHAPILLEQLNYLIKRKQELLQDVTEQYNDFLSFLDERGKRDKESVTFGHLKDIYAFTAERLNAINEQLSYDIEDLEELVGIVTDVQENKNHEQWEELTQELFDEGEYSEKADDFTGAVDREIEIIRKDLDEMLLDWKSAIVEGREDELALLLQAYADELEQEEDEYSFLPENGESESSQKKDGCCRSDESAQCDIDKDDCCGGGCH